MKDNKNKKLIYSFIIIAVLLITVVGVTYSFFNFTRTGNLNSIATGRIYFNSIQNGKLELTNVFPVKSTDLNENTLDSVEVNLTGDTTYTGGEEYLITLTDVQNTVNGKQIPINFIASYTANTGGSIGESSDDYWNERENMDSSIYLLTEEGIVEDGKQVLVGYINDGQTGINGKLTIKAYLDAERIAISDTYPAPTSKYQLNTNMTQEELNACVNSVSGFFPPRYTAGTMFGFCLGTDKNFIHKTFQEMLDNNEFTSSELSYFLENNIIIYNGNGTTEDWVNGRVVLTTEEWNSLQNTPISFKIRAESNEGIWVEGSSVTPSSCFTTSNPTQAYIRNENMDINTCVNKLTEMGTAEGLQDGETLEAFCNGTGTINGLTFQEMLDVDGAPPELENEGIVLKNGYTTSITDYDASCGSNVVIPKNMKIQKVSYTRNENMDINTCVNKLTELWGEKEEGLNVDTGETYESICDGTGTKWGNTFQKWLDNNWFSPYELNEFETSEVVIKNIEGTVATSVKYIGDNAFENKSLTSVIIPNSVIEIGDNAFMGNQLTNVTIPDGITFIGYGTFNSNQLTSVTIPSSVTEIGTYAFSNNQLTSVIIPSSVTTIYNDAFTNNNLTCVEIPTTTNYESAAFDNTVTVHQGDGESCPIYFDDGCFSGIIANNEATINDYNTSCSKDVVIPSTINGYNVVAIGAATIDDSATTPTFNGSFANKGLTSVVIPNGIRKIDNFAFGMNQITNIILPNSITSIGAGSFGDNKLTSIAIPEGIEAIGECAFCENQLSSITLPDLYFDNNSSNMCKDGPTVQQTSTFNNNLIQNTNQYGPRIKRIIEITQEFRLNIVDENTLITNKTGNKSCNAKQYTQQPK